MFSNVFFDIVGFCNAKCPYCLTGAGADKNLKFIEVETFFKTLKKLKSNNIIDSNSVISIYNWGEPFLHPKINDIVDIINKLNLKYAVSTNASKIPEISKNFITNLEHLIYSMSGFSQKSYDRIHGFNFERIRENIEKFTKDLRSLGFKGPIMISYHIYQFNLDEINNCREFANRLGIVFNPYFAILNNWWDLNKLVNNQLPYDKLIKVSEDLFSFEIKTKMKNIPQDYLCPQYNNLIINENADVLVCCQLPKNNPDFICGNILTE